MRWIVVACLCMLAAGTVCAQQSTVSIDCNNTEITQALTSLSQKANMSILGDTTVKGTITCSLSGVTGEQALDTLCKMNKLEWYKTYAGTGVNEKPSASKLFKVLDALRDLGGAAMICTNPTTKTQTVFVPNVGSGSVDGSAIAAGLKLKELYIVRAIPDPNAPKAPDAKPTTLTGAAIGDPAAAAGQVYNYLSQLPIDQQAQVMHDMRHMMYDNMTPAQRDQLRQSYQQQGGGQNGGRRGFGPGGPRGGQNGSGRTTQGTH